MLFLILLAINNYYIKLQNTVYKQVFFLKKNKKTLIDYKDY